VHAGALARLVPGHAARFNETDPLDPARLTWAREAVAMADRLGDDPAWLAVTTSTFQGMAAQDNHVERLAISARAVDLAGSADPVTAAYALFQRVQALMDGGDLEGADGAIAEAERLAERAPLVTVRHVLTMLHSFRALLRGDRAGAEAAADEGLDLGIRFAIPASGATYGGQLYRLRTEFGGLEELAEPFERVVAENPTIPVMRVGLARLYCTIGRREEAARLFEQDAASGFSEVQYGNVSLIALVQCADTAADLGHEPAARLLRDELAPYEHLVGFSSATVEGSVAGALARLAAMLGEPDEAVRFSAAAEALHRRWKAPYWIARTLVDRARAGLSTDGLPEAASIADRYEYRPLQAQIVALA
jgi:hypothetical protein